LQRKDTEYSSNKFVTNYCFVLLNKTYSLPKQCLSECISTFATIYYKSLQLSTYTTRKELYCIIIHCCDSVSDDPILIMLFIYGTFLSC